MNEKKLVQIKFAPNGLTLKFDKDADFEDILRELGKKCSDGRKLFGESTMAISIEGRKLSEIEEIRVIETININCNLNIVCIVDHDDDMNYRYVKALNTMDKKFAALGEQENDGHFFNGSLTDGEKLEVDYSIVILGDVNPGCSVISTGSIIVLGGLYGEAIIKNSLEESANETINIQNNSQDEEFKSVPFIIALEMSPERMLIGEAKYKPETKSKWGIKHKISPQVAYCKNEKMIIEQVSKSVLETVYAL